MFLLGFGAKKVQGTEFSVSAMREMRRGPKNERRGRPNILLVNYDSIKCQCTNSGMKGQMGGFQNSGVCLQAFPSFLPHLLSALTFFTWSLTLVPHSLLLNRMEMLATRANIEEVCHSLTQCQHVFRS